jgi:hypothetical protein
VNPTGLRHSRHHRRTTSEPAGRSPGPASVTPPRRSANARIRGDSHVHAAGEMTEFTTAATT